MQQFNEEHNAAFPNNERGTPAALGHPDGGDGKYSEKLPYKDWVDLNNRERVHMNLVESLPTQLFAFVLGGLFFPRTGTVLAIICTIGRLIYTILYSTKGANYRFIGGVPS